MKAEIRKKQILDCAKSIFSEKGYYDSQVEDIVKLARIGKGTIYQYFRNKEDIFLSLLERFVQEWESEVVLDLNDINNRVPYSHPAVNYLHGIIVRTLLYFKNDHQRGNIILRMGPGLNIEIESYMHRFESRIIHLIKDGIQLGQKFNNIDAQADITVMANFMLGGVLRVAYNCLILEKDIVTDPDINSLAHDIVMNISNGIFTFVYRK
jgi:TetR/AcrR family fatty acid metabolism transcriptional regulator